MKKIVSIIVAVAMLCSILVVPTMAASTVTKSYINDASGNAIGNQTTKKSVTGIAGKAANDVSTFVTRVRPQGEIDSNNTGNHKFQFLTSVDDFGDLVVFEASLYAPANLRTLYLTGNGGVNISKVLNVDSALAPGWNRIVYVYDHSTVGSAVGELAGSYAMYLNGECINEFGENRVNISNLAHNGNQITQLRFMVEDIDPNKEISLYVDDAACYAVTTDDKQAFLDSFEVAKPALDASDKYTVSGDKLIVNGNVTIADVTSASNEVRLFDKGEQIVDTSAVLSLGNTVVVEDKANKLFTYYTVTDGGNVFVNNSDKFVAGTYNAFGTGTHSTVATGFAGNTGAVQKSVTDPKNANCTHWQLLYDADTSTSTREMPTENSAKYIVAGYDVFIPSGHSSFVIGSNQNGGLIGNIATDKLALNAWNTVAFVIKNNATAENATLRADKTMTSSAADKAGIHTVDLYVNGVKLLTDKTAYRFGLWYKNSDTDIRSNEIIRSILTATAETAGTDAGTYYFDDIYMYDTNNYPANIGNVSYPAVTAVNTKLTVAGSKIRLNDATSTMADLTGSNIIVYDGGDYSKVKAADAALEIGDVVTAYNGNTVKKYDVVDSSNIIFEQTVASGFGAKYGATYSDASDDIAGKSGASVKIERGAGLSQQTYIEVNYGKLMSYETPEYVVLEMNYLPVSKPDGFYIAGHQGSSLTAGFADKLVTGQWNNIVVIYTNGSTEDNPTPGGTRYTAADPTATTTATNSKAAAIKASPHSYEVYVNGNLAVSGGAGSSVFGMNWENKSYNKDTGAISTNNRVEQYFRILAPLSSTYGEYTAYIDDVVFYDTDVLDKPKVTAVPELPVIEGLSVVGSSITIDGDVAVSTLPEGVTVYTDATCTTKVTEGNLVNGYEVAYTDGKDVSYYTIELPADKVFADYPEYNSKWAKISNGTTSATTGIDGDENGAYLVYSTSRTGEKPQHNAFYGLGTYTAEFFGERPFSIFSVDFKLGADGDKLFFGSNQHQPISSAVTYSDPRLVDGWNNFVCVVDYETNKSITYVNGIPSTPITSAVGKDLKYTDIRLVVYDRGTEEGNANDATVPVATLDNIKVYASVTNPFAAPLTYEATADSVTFTACDYIKNGYDYVAIAAAFDANDNLVGNVAIGTDTVTIAKNAGAAYYMGYIWNSTTGLIPVTAAVKAE